MHQRELAEKREEEQRDLWFNRIRLMTKVKQTWHEKQLAREENGNNNSEEEVGVTSDKGESTSDKGNSNMDKCSNPDKGEDQQEERPTQMEINMVFTIPA
jgi:phage terminase small subunit